MNQKTHGPMLPGQPPSGWLSPGRPGPMYTFSFPQLRPSVCFTSLGTREKAQLINNTLTHVLEGMSPQLSQRFYRLLSILIHFTIEPLKHFRSITLKTKEATTAVTHTKLERLSLMIGTSSSFVSSCIFLLWRLGIRRLGGVFVNVVDVAYNGMSQQVRLCPSLPVTFMKRQCKCTWG